MSSDSDDDFLGNAAKRLQKLRRQYYEENFKKVESLTSATKTDIEIISDSTPVITPNETNNDLDDSFNIDEVLAKYVNVKKTTRGKRKRNPTDDFLDDPPYVLHQDTKTDGNKRGRRSARLSNIATNRGNIDLRQLDNSPKITKKKTTTKQTRITRAKNGSRNGVTLQNDMLQSQPTQQSFSSHNRGQGGGKRRNVTRSRTRKAHVPVNQSEQYETIPIGNCEDYTDNSEYTPLFNSNSDKVVDLIDDLDNEELSVKVHWRNSEVCKFNIRKFQKLKQIFEHFSKRENVRKEQLLFTYKESIIKCDDTPDSIGYNIAKFIDGGIIDSSIEISKNIDLNNDKGIKIKFQYENSKKPYELTVDPDDRLSLVFLKCAEHIETPLNKLRFQFDGDCLSGTNTARELEFEGGECIDVKIVK